MRQIPIRLNEESTMSVARIHDTYRRLKLARILMIHLIAASIGHAPAFADINLTFGTYAAVKPTETARKFIPFLDYLAQEMTPILGEKVTIKIKISREYEAGISDLTQGRVDFSRFGPASYVMAKEQNPSIQIIAMESKNGAKTFNGVIAVHSESTITDLSDLKGRSFAFGDELSTIGRYLSQAELLDAGISASDLKTYAYLGRHDTVGAAVGNKYFDAGALKENTFKKLQAKNIPIKVLFTFKNVTKPWIASASLPPRIFKALSTAMLRANNPEVLKRISKSGFLDGTDQDYDIIRTAIKRSAEFN
jgi:phosphonate transport system substrate-binding protein